MKKLFEIRMKNGRSYIASTNKKGVCRFSINGRECSIYSDGNRPSGFTFSVEKEIRSEKEERRFPLNQGMEVVSLQEVVLRSKAEAKLFLRGLIELDRRTYKLENVFPGWKETFKLDKQGGIQTTTGWVYGQAR